METARTKRYVFVDPSGSGCTYMRPAAIIGPVHYDPIDLTYRHDRAHLPSKWALMCLVVGVRDKVCVGFVDAFSSMPVPR